MNLLRLGIPADNDRESLTEEHFNHKIIYRLLLEATRVDSIKE